MLKINTNRFLKLHILDHILILTREGRHFMFKKDMHGLENSSVDLKYSGGQVIASNLFYVSASLASAWVNPVLCGGFS